LCTSFNDKEHGVFVRFRAPLQSNVEGGKLAVFLMKRP
jgi:hypothetical protein